MRPSKWQRGLVASAVACAMLPSAARAEIEEVIVTAQKRKESVQEVPIAVTAFDESALKAQQISTFGDVRFAAPNVAYTKDNFHGNNFQIRGVGTWPPPTTTASAFTSTRCRSGIRACSRPNITTSSR